MYKIILLKQSKIKILVSLLVQNIKNKFKNELSHNEITLKQKLFRQEILRMMYFDVYASFENTIKVVK